MHSILQTSIQYVKGVGPIRAQVFGKLGIKTVGDLIYYFPRRYEDRSNFKPIKELSVGKTQTIKGRIQDVSIRQVYRRRNFHIIEVIVVDDTGPVSAMWFNQPYLKGLFKKDDEIILYGKVETYKGHLQIVSPEYELLTDKDDPSLHMGRIVPIYPLTEHLTQRFFRSVIHQALKTYSFRIVDTLPKELRACMKVIDLPNAIRRIHFPDDTGGSLEQAKRRLIFDELFFFNIGLAMRRHRFKDEAIGISHKIEGDMIDSFKESLPFKLTDAQERAMDEILSDMAGPKPMQRLLCGEVGSGKTVVAAFACLAAIQGGYQVAFMVPTEILAEQHYNTLTKLLSPLCIQPICLTSSRHPEHKALSRYKMSSGEAKIVLGTQSLIQKKIRFKNLGLVIIDEQHKFGVIQRLTLKSKGINPDFLVMTATPIPRTLALTLYGDMDITILDELPKGRGTLETHLMSEAMRHRSYALITREVKKGRQAYIIYPVVNESSRLELRAATQMYRRLKGDVFKDFSVGLVHGKMDLSERQDMMREFRDGRINILISTVVVEVGIDVPNATVVVIEHAERFGLAQLHQLRGRIARGPYPSYCILVSDTEERLKILTQTNDGLKIAEKDLLLRGSGDFFGTRQAGLPEFKIANPISDVQLLEESRDAAFKLIHNDPYLRLPDHRRIRALAYERFRGLEMEIMGA